MRGFSTTLLRCGLYAHCHLIYLHIQGSDFKAEIRMKQLAQNNCALPIYLRMYIKESLLLKG